MNFPWIKRPDLIFQSHDSGGWLIKDPLTLSYTLLDDAEYQILQLMDGSLTLKELIRRARRWVPDRDLTADDIGQFVQSLAGNQLIRRTSTGDAERLKPASPSSWLGRGFRLLLNILRIQIPLVNPSRAIDRILPSLQFAFSLSFRLAATMLMTAALVIVLTSFRPMIDQIPSMEQFLGPSNLVLLLMTFVVVKILHEAGHAVTARHYGAECNECGIMLMILTPVLYTNVTDGWRLPRKQRMEITAAGIMVELVIASTATILWWLAAPGLTRSLLFNLMLICSVNTILFNGNPLLRFDGYFLLSDWWRIPNLSSRASATTQSFLIRFITGCQQDETELSSTRRKLLVYGVAAAIYRLFLSLAILQLILHVAREAQFEIFGSVVSCVFLVGVVVLPTLRFAREVAESISERLAAGSGVMRVVFTVALPLCVLLIPLPASILAPASVEPAGKPVYLQLSGHLTPVVEYGDSVAEGAELALLTNLNLSRTRTELKGRVEELREEINMLTNNLQTSDSPLLPTLEAAKRSAEADLASFDVELREQTVISPASGILLPPVARPETGDADLPDFWNDLPLAPRNSHAWMQRGTLIGHVGQKDQLKLVCCVSESDVSDVRVGQSLHFLATAGDSPLSGEVTEVAGMPAKEVASHFGVAGLLSGTPFESGWKPADTIYVVTADLDSHDHAAAPALHTVGHVRIFTNPGSVARRLFRYLRRTFS